MDHLCEIISKLGKGFRRSCRLSQLSTVGWTKTDHKSSPCQFVTGEPIKPKTVLFLATRPLFERTC